MPMDVPQAHANLGSNAIVYQGVCRDVRAFEAGPKEAPAKGRGQNNSVTGTGALSPFTLAPETPARRFCRRDKSAHAHPVPRWLSVRAQ
jgi:hypothetical protein